MRRRVANEVRQRGHSISPAGLRFAHDPPLQPAFPHRDPTAMAWRVRGGRWRRPEPRYRDRRGPPCVHDQRAKPSLHSPAPHRPRHGRAQPHERTRHVGIRLAAAGAPRGRACARWRRPRSFDARALLTHQTWHCRAGEYHFRCNALGRGAAPAHGLAGRDHDGISPAGRTMATALSGRLACARVQRPRRVTRR